MEHIDVDNTVTSVNLKLRDTRQTDHVYLPVSFTISTKIFSTTVNTMYTGWRQQKTIIGHRDAANSNFWD